MAKEKEKKEVTTPAVANQEESVRDANLMTNNAVKAAFEEIEKEKDEKKKRDAKEAICILVYNNRVDRAELRKSRREEDIKKEKLTSSKELLERVLGVETEIQKDGSLLPTDKKIDEAKKISPTEYKREKDTMKEDLRKKLRESNEIFDKEIAEIRSSYEGQWRYYWD
jgi:hypothetical protein